MLTPWNRISALTVVLAGAATLLASSPAFASDCWLGLGPALEAGGYSAYGPCDEDGGGVHLTYVGHTKPYRGHSYYVYNLIYTAQGDPGTAVHGGQRVLIFDSHRRYVGHYHLDTPPFRRVWVSGFDVRINVPAGHGDRISLKAATPPEGAMLDQDYIDLQR